MESLFLPFNPVAGVDGRIRSDEDDFDNNEDSTVESSENSTDESSSSDEEDSTVTSKGDHTNDVDAHKSANVLLNIHDQLDLDKLQKVIWSSRQKGETVL